MPATRTLLAIFAHPDDEAFGTGGVLSKYAAQGVNVHLITATCGEAGQIADPALATPQTLARVREQELRCACRTYGINPPHLLRYPDGQTSQVNQKEAVGKIVHLIRRLKPQVVIAFGPDGIYGHYDHLVLHRWAVLAVDLAADPEWFPEQLTARRRTHTVGRLYYRAMPQSLIDSMRRDGGG
ncbi:MAG: PIG-L deacetylase family protein, partial [Anaerolineae bacterium]